jgi:lysophospholipase L1-like esterase
MGQGPPAATGRPIAAVARQVGAVAAYTGGALTAAGALSLGVLLGQVLIARLTIPGAEAPPPRCNGDYGLRFAPATPLRLAVIGDSTAAGYGVRTRAETPGALLAGWISNAARRPVRVTCPAVVGSLSAWLEAQVETTIEAGVDVAVIFIGANDVTTGVNEHAAVRHLADAVEALRAAGAEVVVATCPDLGTVRPIRPPLRWVARRLSRQMAAAQAVAVARAGGRAVSLGDLLGPRFDAAPEQMFGADRFHPSAEGYRAASLVVLPSVLAALDLPADGQPATGRPAPAEGRPRHGEYALSLSDAAVKAADDPGTEVTADGPFGRLRRRVRHLAPAVTRSPATHRDDFPVPSLTGASDGPPRRAR